MARLALLVGLVAIALVVFRFDLPDLWSRRERLTSLIAEAGPWGPAVFSGLKILTVVLALPSAPVTMAGGFLFGPVLGTVVNILAATAGACLTFFIGRFLGRETVQRFLPARLQTLDAHLAGRGLRVILSMRLIPLVPFNGLNYGAGLTRVSFRDYLVGTAIGISPGATLYTLMGHSAAEASVPGVGFALAGLGLLSLLPVVSRRWQVRKDRTSPSDAR